MTVYIVILFVVTLLAILGAVVRATQRQSILLLYCPAFLILMVPPAIRFQTGWDWEAYDRMAGMIDMAPVGYVSGDVAFDFMLMLANWLGVPIYALTAILIVGGFSYLLKDWCPSPKYAGIATIFFLWYGYYSTWSTIRQGVSVMWFTAGVLSGGAALPAVFFSLALLTHKSAAAPIALFLVYRALWRVRKLRGRGKFVVLSALGLAAVAYALLPSIIDTKSLVRNYLQWALGPTRTEAFANRSFFLDAYPLITGRLVEILGSLVVLWNLGRYYVGEDGWREKVKLLFNLQVMHLTVYLVCSPLTFLAERQVLFFDYIHCFATSVTLLSLPMFYRPRWVLGPRSFHRLTNQAAAVALVLFSAYYVGSRYSRMLVAESRAGNEYSHYQRFIPYRSILSE